MSNTELSLTIKEYFIAKALGVEIQLPYYRECDVISYAEESEWVDAIVVSLHHIETGEDFEMGYYKTKRCGCSVGMYLDPTKIRDPHETPLRVKHDDSRGYTVMKCEKHADTKLRVELPDPGWVQVQLV